MQQANGNPQALADLLVDARKEWLVDKRKIREMRHVAGVRYLDFTPGMIVALASIVGARYLAMGTGDTELYIFAGMLAAVVIMRRIEAHYDESDLQDDLDALRELCCLA